ASADAGDELLQLDGAECLEATQPPAAISNLWAVSRPGTPVMMVKSSASERAEVPCCASRERGRSERRNSAGGGGGDLVAGRARSEVWVCRTQGRWWIDRRSTWLILPP